MRTEPATAEDEDDGPHAGAGEGDPTPAESPAGLHAPAPGKKATKAVVSKRVEDVLRLRIDGATLPDIRDYAARQTPPWDVSDSQLKRYIVQSDALLKEMTDRNVYRSFRMHIARRNGLYARALAAADYRTALAVLTDIAKLEGHYDDRETLEKELKELARLVEAGAPHPTTTETVSHASQDQATEETGRR